MSLLISMRGVEQGIRTISSLTPTLHTNSYSSEGCHQCENVETFSYNYTRLHHRMPKSASAATATAVGLDYFLRPRIPRGKKNAI